MAHSQPEDDSFLKTADVMRRYGVSKMFIARKLETDPSFPRPVKLGRNRFWKLGELRSWEERKAVRL